MINITRTYTKSLTLQNKLPLLFKLQKFNFRTEKISKLENFTERKTKSTNFYMPKHLLIFENGRLGLINTKESSYIKLMKRNNFFTNFLIISTSIISIYSIIKLNLTILTISTILFLISLLMKRNLNRNLSRIVTDFSLLEDGKTIEIITLKKKFNINIKLLSRPNRDQLLALKNFNPLIAKLAVPILVEKGEHKGFYYVTSDGEYEGNKEIINAVMNNSYIKVDNKIGRKDKII